MAHHAFHHAFHRALLTGAKSPRLESIATELRDCSLLYQHWSIEVATRTQTSPLSTGASLKPPSQGTPKAQSKR